MKEKVFSVNGVGISKDGTKHHVTIVATYLQQRGKVVEIESSSRYDGEYDLYCQYIKQKTRTLKIGYSICHPEDKFDEDYGVKLALKRIKDGDINGKLITNDFTMLTKDMIQCILDCKLKYFTENIDKYLRKRNRG
jgi:hypothetical protein